MAATGRGCVETALCGRLRQVRRRRAWRVSSRALIAASRCFLLIGWTSGSVRIAPSALSISLSKSSICSVLGSPLPPARTGRPGYHPAVPLKLFIYGYLNRIPSSRRLEREAGRKVEVMWLTGKLVPDHKTIADFRRDNGVGIRKVCAQFVELCRRIGPLKGDCVAIDGSKFKAVNNRDKTFTKGKIANRIAHLEADVDHYITKMVRIDRQEDGEARAGRSSICPAAMAASGRRSRGSGRWTKPWPMRQMDLSRFGAAPLIT